MAAFKLVSLFVCVVFVLSASRALCGVDATPVINTASSTGIVEQQHQQVAPVSSVLTDSASVAAAQQATGPPSKYPLSGANNVRLQVRAANTAEKLKRGLNNFVNHLNPAPYFVPVQPIQQGHNGPNTSGKGKQAATGVQAEPATIINDAPSADVLIKGPNRLVQARPLGGPLRWGR